MSGSIEFEIEKCEERLKQAMLQSDLVILDEMLSPDLIFTNHLGQLMFKKDDLKAHDTGILDIKKIILTDQIINVCGDVAIVSVKAHISGSFAGEESESDFRFTRVWNKSSNAHWQVVAAHSSMVV